MNEANRKVLTVIFKSYGGWIYDDANQTDLPQAADNLVSGTAKYALPTDALTVNRVEVKDNNGNWGRVDAYSQETVTDSLTDFAGTSGTPILYRLIGNTIEFAPTPDYNSTGGFKVFFDRDSVNFAYTDTTKTPGFASTFHNALAVGASIEWIKVKQPDSKVLPSLNNDWVKYEQDISDFYISRWTDLKPKIITRQHNWQ